MMYREWQLVPFLNGSNGNYYLLTEIIYPMISLKLFHTNVATDRLNKKWAQNKINEQYLNSPTFKPST